MHPRGRTGSKTPGSSSRRLSCKGPGAAGAVIKPAAAEPAAKLLRANGMRGIAARAPPRVTPPFPCRCPLAAEAMPAPPLAGAGERGVPRRGAGMGGRGVTPLCCPRRWREAGGGDGSREAAGGSRGVGAAQESRGFQREPRGRSDGNGVGRGLWRSLVREQSAPSRAQPRGSKGSGRCHQEAS